MKHLLTFILIVTVYTAQAQGIKFEENLTWTQIKAKAKAESKYIFMDAYTTWCRPCKKMSSETFPKKEVGDFINDKFISVKVQMDQTNNDDEFVKSWYADAKLIDQEYKITAYPTILFFSSDGNLAGRAIGYKEDKDLIKEVKEVIDDYQEFNSIYVEYNDGKRDPVFVKQLAKLAKKMGQTETAEKIAQRYINGLSEIDLFNIENLKFVYEFTTSSKDRGFNVFTKQSIKANSVFGMDNSALKKNTAETKVRSIIGKEEIEPLIRDKNNISDWNSIERRIRSKYGMLGLEAYYGERMTDAIKKKDWSNFGKYYALYYTTAYGRSKFHINNISWSIFEQVNNPKVLDVAVKTMKYDIEHFDQNDVGSYDTYANLLYKAGKMQEAILWEEKAVRLEEENASKSDRKPDPVFAENLRKMRAGVPTWPVEESKK